jgi:hypothetical protein
LVRELITNLKGEPFAFDPEDAVVSKGTIVFDANETPRFATSEFASITGFSSVLNSWQQQQQQQITA